MCIGISEPHPYKVHTKSGEEYKLKSSCSWQIGQELTRIAKFASPSKVGITTKFASDPSKQPIGQDQGSPLSTFVKAMLLKEDIRRDPGSPSSTLVETRAPWGAPASRPNTLVESFVKVQAPHQAPSSRTKLPPSSTPIKIQTPSSSNFVESQAPHRTPLLMPRLPVKHHCQGPCFP